MAVKSQRGSLKQPWRRQHASTCRGAAALAACVAPLHVHINATVCDARSVRLATERPNIPPPPPWRRAHVSLTSFFSPGLRLETHGRLLPRGQEEPQCGRPATGRSPARISPAVKCTLLMAREGWGGALTVASHCWREALTLKRRPRRLGPTCRSGDECSPFRFQWAVFIIMPHLSNWDTPSLSRRTVATEQKNHHPSDASRWGQWRR